MKKVLLVSCLVVSLQASWLGLGNDVEDTLNKAREFQCKSLEQSIKSDISIVSTKSEHSKQIDALNRLELNIVLMGNKCNKDYNEYQETVRDLKQIVNGTMK